MKPSAISQALPRAASNTAPAISRVAPALPSCTLVTDSTASPSQQNIRVVEADMATSRSIQDIDQRKQQHPDQIDHVPIEHAGHKRAAIARAIDPAPAALGQPAKDEQTEQHMDEVKTGEDPVQGEEGVVLHAQPRSDQMA